MQGSAVLRVAFSSWPGAAVFSAFRATEESGALAEGTLPQAASSVAASTALRTMPGTASRRRIVPGLTANRYMSASVIQLNPSV